MPEEKGGKAPELSKRRNVIVTMMMPSSRPLERSDSQAHFQAHSRSKTVAKPCPTPTQSDAMPREAPVRAIWWISVVARRQFNEWMHNRDVAAASHVACFKHSSSPRDCSSECQAHLRLRRASPARREARLGL